MTGSISEGFRLAVLPEAFAIELAEAEPLLSGCAF